MLILVRGLPGSGKSTFVHQYLPHLFHVENDMFFMRDGGYHYDDARRNEAIGWVSGLVEQALLNGSDVVVSTCMLLKKHVDFYVGLARVLRHEWYVIHCDRDYGSVHRVPEEVMKKFKEEWEPYPGGEFSPEQFVKYMGLKPYFSLPLNTTIV